MIKKLFIAFVLLSSTCVIAHAQMKNVYSEQRTVNEFSKISASNAIDVRITEGSSNTITVEANLVEIIPFIQTEVTNGELKVYLKKGNKPKHKNSQMTVHVSASNLTEINASSAADIYSVEMLTTDEIKLSASSGSDIKLQLTANSITCSASSGSDIRLKGTATSANVRASSGADIDMKEMTVVNADVSASSGSDIHLYVTGKLNASASSGADITYKGNPEYVDQSKSSGGSIKKK